MGAVAPRTGPGTHVAQGDRGLPGHRPHGGRRRRPARRGGVGRRGGRARAARPLVRHRGAHAAPDVGVPPPRGRGPRSLAGARADGRRRARAAVTTQTRARTGRRVAGHVLTTLAVLLVWVALVAPNPAVGWSPTPLALLRIPLEALVLVAGLLLLRGVAARSFTIAVGLGLGV